MTISLVIPAYNEEKYIGNCLASLESQIEKPDEIIVVDNNCSDKTIEIVKRFKVKIVKEKRRGMIYARNCGFNNAQGDIIARCDADTILPPDWIKKIKENFERLKIDALTGPVVLYDLPLKTSLYANIYFDLMKALHGGNDILSGPNIAITKNIWDKVKNEVCLDDSKVHEDVDLAIHILQIGGKIRRDRSLIIQTSGRRIKHRPLSFFGEYPLRLVRTLYHH